MNGQKHAHDILYTSEKEKKRTRPLYEDAKENEMSLIRFLLFIPDLISLWNWWAFVWSWWNGWCWTTRIIKRKIYSLLFSNFTSFINNKQQTSIFISNHLHRRDRRWQASRLWACSTLLIHHRSAK